MNIYIFNISSAVQSEDLKNMFSVYGNVQSAEVMKDIVSGDSRGFGFVEMESDTAAQNAIDALNQTEIDTLLVTVQESSR